VRSGVVAAGCRRAYPGDVPTSAVPQLRVHRPTGRVLAELALGLLLGVVGGWIAGLVRVRQPGPSA
jgi:hypothetical protein